MKSLLQHYYARTFPARQDVQITDLEELVAGWESDIFFFTAHYGPSYAREQDNTVLRIYPGDDGLAKARREYDLLRRLASSGYPVPLVYALAAEDSPLGKPFIMMEQVPGVTMWRPLFHGDDSQAQDALLTQFCQLFVDLHRLDWRSIVDEPHRYEKGDPYLFVDREIGSIVNRLGAWRWLFCKLGFDKVLQHLRDHRHSVPSKRPSAVHWDFHPNNVLLRPDGAATVLDWTQGGISDERFDLGWTLALVDSQVSSVWRERILHRYQELAGYSIDALDYFESFACFKRLLVFAVTVHGGARALGLRPDLAQHAARHLGSMQRLYERQVELTGLRQAGLERLLDEGLPGG